MAHPVDTGAVTRIDPPVASNAGTPQTLVSGVAKNKIYIASLFVRNTGANTRTVTLQSKGSGAAKVIGKFDVAAQPCTAIIDGRAGRYECDPGEDLKFITDAGTDVEISGSVVIHP